jgi:hypothetical protein
MRLDSRIEVGSTVLVKRDLKAEVISIAEDRSSCQVRPLGTPPPAEGEQPAQPPMMVAWSEVKLVDDHL